MIFELNQKIILFLLICITEERRNSKNFTNITNSKDITPGDLFIAIKGLTVDGHDYISKSIELGAKSIVVEEFPKEIIEGICYVKVESSSYSMSVIASNYFDNPSSKIKLVGVTGTNGKTTTAFLVKSILENANLKVALIGTLGLIAKDFKYQKTLTTPDPIALHKILHDLNAVGFSHIVMEVSSHGIDQKRVTGLQFQGAIFSNLTHDHLDYHSTFKAYRDSKKKLFDGLNNTAFALVNSDDKNAKVMVQNCKAKIYTYALHSYADYSAKVLESQFKGCLLYTSDAADE